MKIIKANKRNIKKNNNNKKNKIKIKLYSSKIPD